MIRERVVAAAGSTTGRLGLLALLVLVVWLASVAVATLSGAFADFGEAAWSGLRHLLDPGSLGDDEGAGERIIGVVQVLAGIVFLVGVLFTVLADLVDRGLTRLGEANPPLHAAGHVVLIGEGAGPLARLLLAAPPASGIEQLVVLTPPGSHDQSASWTSTERRVQVRNGDPRDPGVLAGVATARARAIIYVGTSEPDPMVADLAALEVGAAIAAELEGCSGERPRVAIEVRRWPHVADLWDDFPPEFDAVIRARGLGVPLALAVANPDFAVQLAAASPVDDDSVPAVIAPGAAAGRPFSEALASLGGERLPQGLVRDGHPLYAPPADETVREDDGLIVLETPTRRWRPAVPGERRAAPLKLGASPTPRLLVLGWSEIGRSLFAELDETVDVAVLLGTDPPSDAPEQALVVGELETREALDGALASHRPDVVVVLGGGRDAAEAEAAHARAAFVALHLCDLSDRELPIIVEQGSVERGQRLREADPRIAVVSESGATAGALLLSALDHPRQAATEALGTDPALRIETCLVEGEEPVPIADAWGELLERRMVLMGLSRGGASRSLSDPASDPLLPGDRLMIVERLRWASATG